IRFFFQAEDGIRDRTVTGVQTCALPIFQVVLGRAAGEDVVRLLGERIGDEGEPVAGRARMAVPVIAGDCRAIGGVAVELEKALEIGRASCRERAWTV